MKENQMPLWEKIKQKASEVSTLKESVSGLLQSSSQLVKEQFTMSSKETTGTEKEKIKSVRRKHDQYFSPSWATEILLERFPGINGRILEPCSGNGHMAGILKAIPNSVVVTNDIDPKMKAMFNYDAKQDALYHRADAEWIISNCPYSQALEIVAKSYEHCKKGCAFLLRLSFLEPTSDRGPWLKAHLPKFICVLPRISFTEDGRCDSVTSVWVVWHKLQVDTMPPFDFVPRAEIKKETA